MTKQKLLESLYNEYREEYRGKEIVVGDGNTEAQLFLIGEAPGRDEVKLSKPFVGMAGKNLTEFLNILGIDRKDIYISNAIKYRLSEVNPHSGRLVNRPASTEEISANREYLLKEIEIVNPQCIVTLGNVPLKSVTGNYSATIGTVHGEAAKIQVLNKKYILFPLYHPASIIYNSNLKKTYIEDLEKLKQTIKSQKLISP